MLVSVAAAVGLAAGLVGLFGVAAVGAQSVVTRTATTYFDLNTCNGGTVTGSGTVTMVQKQTSDGFSTRSTSKFTATDEAGNEYQASQTFSNVSTALQLRGHRPDSSGD